MRKEGAVLWKQRFDPRPKLKSFPVASPTAPPWPRLPPALFLRALALGHYGSSLKGWGPHGNFKCVCSRIQLESRFRAGVSGLGFRASLHGLVLNKLSISAPHPRLHVDPTKTPLNPQRPTLQLNKTAPQRLLQTLESLLNACSIFWRVSRHKSRAPEPFLEPRAPRKTWGCVLTCWVRRL